LLRERKHANLLTLARGVVDGWSMTGARGTAETEMVPMTATVCDEAQLRFVPMRKPKKFWKVGDLARAVGISRQAIHNYTLLGLIQETERTPAGHRLFDDEVFSRLQKIERLKNKGLRLTEIAALLNEPKRPRGRRDAKDEREPAEHDERTGETR
jgi:DNA-binding transcriptional MerR regulator